MSHGSEAACCLSVFIFYGCETLPQTQGLKPTDMSTLATPEARHWNQSVSMPGSFWRLSGGFAACSHFRTLPSIFVFLGLWTQLSSPSFCTRPPLLRQRVSFPLQKDASPQIQDQSDPRWFVVLGAFSICLSVFFPWDRSLAKLGAALAGSEPQQSLCLLPPSTALGLKARTQPHLISKMNAEHGLGEQPLLCRLTWSSRPIS